MLRLPNLSGHRVRLVQDKDKNILFYPVQPLLQVRPDIQSFVIYSSDGISIDKDTDCLNAGLSELFTCPT